jgi:preprotein translocase subunit SecG
MFELDGQTAVVTGGARGAGDLLTRTTWILAGIALAICVAITLIANHNRSSGSVTDRIDPNNLNIAPAATPQQQQAPASSAGPVAPPLPGSAPPLPGAAPALPGAPTTVLPTEAPRPTARTPQRRAPSPATRLPASVGTQPADPLANAAPKPVQPKIDLTAPASSSNPQ